MGKFESLIVGAIAIWFGTGEVAKAYDGKIATMVGSVAWLLLALANLNRGNVEVTCKSKSED